GAWVAKMITEFSWEFGDSVLGVIFPLAVVGYVISEGIVAPVAFIRCGAKIAPARKNVVASVLGCVYAAYCVVLSVWVFVLLGDHAVDWVLHSMGSITALGGQDHVVPEFVVFAPMPVAAVIGIWGAIGTWLGHWSWEIETIGHAPTVNGQQTTTGGDHKTHIGVEESNLPRDDALMHALQVSLDAAKNGAAQTRETAGLTQALREVGFSEGDVARMIRTADQSTLQVVAERVAAASPISTWSAQEQKMFRELTELLLKSPEA
ncbi:MAG: hypothetical protein M3069_00800, partial [Chloroflexota bacterium]|nr:hypothetical protein [Chloroflexota bacterium]